MEKKRILFISQEITPYLPENHISKISRELPQGIQERGKEIRVFMPKFGKINERRNQLHEVIRLSGMNLIINDTDHPLIIKVASIQAAKMQVYFIDNDELFYEKAIFKNEKGEEFDNNDEKAIFFARGVIETIKKLRWSPDIIHCHGWMTNLIPMYIKKSYRTDPLFQNTKIVFSVYNDEFKTTLNEQYKDKAVFKGVIDEDLQHLSQPDFVSVHKHAIQHSDAVIYGCSTINPEIESFVKENKLPVLDYQSEDTYIDAYSEFYDSILD
ncbi:MAG: glycogen/starch synthase [Bacteroidales bacterium]|nr:glycogen/starch synthase [Bacteroidales bacterium]